MGIYVPTKISMLIGNPSALARAKEWASLWASGRQQKPLLIFGPPGTGKTALAHAIASEFGWDIFEFNASDLRDEKNASFLLGSSSQSSALFGSLRLILIDDADSLSGKEDRGGMAAIAKAIQVARQPVILTAIDYWDKTLQPLRSLCEPIELRRVQASTIEALLQKVAAKNNIPLSQQQIRQIAESAKGDVRAALNDLEARNTAASRDMEKNVFEVVRAIFKSEKYSESRQAAFLSEVEHDLLKWWVASNLPSEYERPFDLARAYNAISKADVFDGRILRMQYWGYLRYSTDHLSAGVSLAKSEPYRKYTQLSFPSYFQQLGATKSSRKLRKEILRKISLACHCSVADAAIFLPQIEHFAKKEPQSLAQFGFSEDELAFLASTKKPKHPKQSAL
jgi:replication factor C large subunit